MHRFIKIFAFLVMSLPALSYAQELKICDEGIGKCSPLIKDSAKYSKCMRLMCFQYYSEKDKKEDDSKFYFQYEDVQETNISKRPKGQMASEIVRSCDYGLRKCETLRYSPEYYWECMADSCNAVPENYNPACPDGRDQCVDRQKIYNDCMLLTCGDANATFETCSEARSSCAASLKNYWQCVYGICLGPVDKYVKPAATRKFMIVRDANGIKKRVEVSRIAPIMVGAPKWLAGAPRNVDPDEWSQTMPQKFMITGNPTDYMQCLIPTAMIECTQDDIRSCTCSDGSFPIMLEGVPSPYYQDKKPN